MIVPDEISTPATSPEQVLAAAVLHQLAVDCRSSQPHLRVSVEKCLADPADLTVWLDALGLDHTAFCARLEERLRGGGPRLPPRGWTYRP